MIDRYERIVEADRFVDGMQSIASRVDVPIVNAITRLFTAEFTSVTEPIADSGRWGLAGKLSANSISLTPLFPTDAGTHEYFAELIKQKALRYSEPERTVYMPAGVLSNEVGGLILIHEGIHAYAHQNNLWRHEPGNWSHWLEEVHAYVGELAVMHQIAGGDYESAVVRIADYYERKSAEIENDDSFPTLEVGAVIDKITDNPTPDDVKILDSAMNIGGMFYVFNKGFVIQSEHLNICADYLRWLYDSPPDPVPLPKMSMPLQLENTHEH